MTLPVVPSRVWTGFDASVQVYVLDDNNRRVDFFQTGDPNQPAVSYCYFQNAVMSSDMPYNRRPVTGRPTKRILRDTDEWEMTVQYFYLSFFYEFDPLQLFDRNHKLELILALEKTENILENELLILKPCFRISCSVGGQENGIFNGSAKFAGEGFEFSR